MGRAFEVRKAAMAKTSAAKTKVYSKFGKEIYIAAKSGEPNPDMNQSLRRIIVRRNQLKSLQISLSVLLIKPKATMILNTMKSDTKDLDQEQPPSLWSV